MILTIREEPLKFEHILSIRIYFWHCREVVIHSAGKLSLFIVSVKPADAVIIYSNEFTLIKDAISPNKKASFIPT